MSITNLLQSALDAQRAGRLAEAEGAYQQLLREHPQHAAAHHNLALLLLQQNRLDAALDHMREAARLQPKSLEIQNNLGGLWEHAGRWCEAIQAYQQAADLAPESPVPHFNLGEALCKVGRSAEAVAPLRAAATLDPDLPEAWRALGSALLDAGHPQAALAALQRAVKLRPEDDEAQYGLGHALMECGRIVQAVQTFQHCLTTEPQHALALHDLGKCLFDLGCLEQALPLLRQAADAGSDTVRQHAWENIAVIVPGSPADDNRSILDARQTWGRQWPNRPAPPPRQLAHDQPLRIGYVSSFFHRANWMKPVRALIQRHDRKRLAIHLFCNGPAEELRSYYRLHDGDHVHEIQGESNETL
ncbi:MAG: tetratricopeptide repeat protein, partial [Planctomycetaceae bacterium]